MERIKVFIYYYGFRAGLTLMILPIAWDLVWSGAREIVHISICPAGIITQVIGFALVLMGGRDPR